MSHNYLNKSRTQELINTIRGHLSDIATVLSNLASGDARDNTKVEKSGDSMTGSLRFPDSTGIWGVDTYYSQGISFTDDGNYGYMSIGSLQNTEGRLTCKYDKIEYNGYELATLNDIPSAAVSGVKGNTETDYRTGNVNITAANIGAVRYDTSSQGLTSTQKSNARTNLGLGTAATYSSSSFATYTQGSYATNFNSNFKPIFTTSGQSHASVFRGKYLGSSFTSAQKAAIADGSFDDLFVGDYWTIGGVNWRIADIDYYMHHGDTECTTHHIVIVPDSSLTTSSMNPGNDTSTGYYGSYMFQTTLGLGTSGTVYNRIANAFGSDFLLSHRELLCNAVSNGNPSGWVWHSTKISIMNQAQILGQKMWMGGSQDARNLGISDSQFQLFKIAHQFIPLSPRGSFWLRDIISISDFVYIINNGTPYNAGGCTASLGVRPYFCLKGA